MPANVSLKLIYGSWILYVQLLRVVSVFCQSEESWLTKRVSVKNDEGIEYSNLMVVRMYISVCSCMRARVCVQSLNAHLIRKLVGLSEMFLLLASSVFCV